MKKLFLALLATGVAIAAGPALAHGDDDDDAWGAPSYQMFDQQYRHIWDGIQHGLSDGSFSRLGPERITSGPRAAKIRFSGVLAGNDQAAMTRKITQLTPVFIYCENGIVVLRVYP